MKPMSSVCLPKISLLKYLKDVHFLSIVSLIILTASTVLHFFQHSQNKKKCNKNNIKNQKSTLINHENYNMILLINIKRKFYSFYNA